MGRAWIFGDNVSTDHIIPGRLNIALDPKLLAEAMFHYARPEFTKQVKPRDVVIGGENFGCGSSREHAVIGLKATGICIIAKSYGWIFFRNCINNGILPLQSLEKLEDKIGDGDNVELDLRNWQLINKTDGKKYSLKRLPEFINRICQAGGMVNYLNKYGKIGKGNK